MAVTRVSLAAEYAAHDAIIEGAQAAKRDATQAYREKLAADGMDKDNIKAEIDGFKVAYRRKVAIDKNGADEVEYRDAIADEIFLEITAARAPRATRVENIDEFGAKGADTGRLKSEPIADHDPITGEITEPARNEAAASRSSASPIAPAPANQSPAGNDFGGAVEASIVTSPAGAEGDKDRQPIQPETANEEGGGFPVAAAPHESGATGGDEGDQTSQPANVGGTPDVTAGETAPHSNIVALDTSSSADDAGEASSLPASPATPFRSHNPATHFLNAGGLARLHGCINPDRCGAETPRKALCFSCSVQHDGPTPHLEGAE